MKRNKWIAVAVAGAMAVSLTACQNKAETNSPATAGTTVNQPAQPVTEAVVAPSTGGTEAGKTGESKTPADFATFKIGVCESQASDLTVLRRAYYEDYIAPKYNVEFVFSEQLKTADEEMNFIENCVDLGAKGIISYRSNDANQMAKVCQEYGLAYAVNTTRTPAVEEAFVSGLDSFTGVWGTEPAIVADKFKEWIKSVSSDDGHEGFIVTSALAFKGNTMHAECTQGVLAALQELYGITYEDSIENLAATAVPLEVPNDKGINIYIYPGTNSTTDNWVQGVSTALQTGKYGVFLQPAPTFTYTGVAVDEVEKGFGIDMKVATYATIGDTLTAAFHTDDKYGNPSLDMAMVQSASLVSGLGFVQIYNQLTGYSYLNDTPKGEPAGFNMPMWALTSREEVDEASKWDRAEEGSWVIDERAINDMLGIYHPDLTYDKLQDYYNGITYDWAKNHVSS